MSECSDRPNNELIGMWQAVLGSIENIETPIVNSGFSTLVLNIKAENIKWLIEKTIKALEERPQGEWNYIQAGMAVCPFCGASPHKDYKNFCPNCGAEM